MRRTRRRRAGRAGRRERRGHGGERDETDDGESDEQHRFGVTHVHHELGGQALGPREKRPPGRHVAVAEGKEERAARLLHENRPRQEHQHEDGQERGPRTKQRDESLPRPRPAHFGDEAQRHDEHGKGQDSGRVGGAEQDAHDREPRERRDPARLHGPTRRGRIESDVLCVLQAHAHRAIERHDRDDARHQAGRVHPDVLQREEHDRREPDRHDVPRAEPPEVAHEERRDDDERETGVDDVAGVIDRRDRDERRVQVHLPAERRGAPRRERLEHRPGLDQVLGELEVKRRVVRGLKPVVSEVGHEGQHPERVGGRRHGEHRVPTSRPSSRATSRAASQVAPRESAAGAVALRTA